MDYVDTFLTFSAILNFAIVTLNACNTWFGKLKFFNFKQGRMIPYEVAFLGNALSALVFALAELHNVSQGSSRGIAAASSSGVCSAVSCGQVKSKDVLYSDD